MSKRTQRMKRLELLDQILTVSAWEDKTMGFTIPLLTNFSFPCRQVEGNEYFRKNGKYQYSLLTPSQIKLPCGVFPRILSIWLITSAKLGKSRQISLCNSINKFLSALGKRSTGGKNGTITSLKEQSKRLFGTTVLRIDDTEKHWAIEKYNFIENAAVFSGYSNSSYWEAELLLDQSFYREIQEHAFPIDMRVIRYFSRYPMAMDIYCWLTYRYFYLSRPTLVSWTQLENQFGGQFARQSHFVERYLEALKNVKVLYTRANYKIRDNGILLLPSAPHVKVLE